MALNSRPDSDDGPATDDAYWTALFEQEEASTESPPPSKKEEWSIINDPLDGRSHPSDNGKETNEDQDPWQVAQSFLESDQVLQLAATGCNKGGLLVQWNGLQGFVPASQLVDFPQFHFEAERRHALRQWIDKFLKLKIVEVNQPSNRLILSERAALVKVGQRESLFNRIQPGDKVEGHVTNLTHFGAFVDLGGGEGLIHISELSWSRVNHPIDVIQPNQAVTVLVMNVDQENRRVALSLKRMNSDPWQTAEFRYKPGQIVEGVVSNVVNYGAFVLLEKELEGLIHISELAEGTFLHPRNVIQNGDRVVAQVLNVNGAAKRLALSLRSVKGQDNGR